MNHQTDNQSRSILRELRALMPERVLSYPEALQRAELQAGRLLSLHGLTKGAVPTEIINELPRIRTDREWDMPASGSAHWDGSAWVITLNAAEHELRQRFSTFHEFKHILDHPTRHLIEGDRQYRLTAEQMAEKVADYFAACVLMPRAWVKSAFCAHTQSTESLAAEFNVSAKAMSVRLAQLGLSTPVDRCAHSQRAGAYRRRGHYFRQLPARPLLEGVAA